MRSPLARFALLAVASVACALLATTSARADDCPPGSIYRTQDGYSFCEATICENDGHCNPTTEVCRPIALCLQVGTLDPKKTTLTGDAGQRLVVTQRCAPDKTCPQTTICSDKGRCVAKTVAEKMGILDTPSAASSASAGANGAGPAPSGKKSCGCHAVGADGQGSPAVGTGGLLAGVAIAITASRRRRRRDQ